MIFRIPTSLSEVFRRDAKSSVPGKHESGPPPVTHEEIAAVHQAQVAALDEADAKEKDMGTAATLPVAGAAKPESKFHSILDHLKAFFGVAIKDVQADVPAAAGIVEALFPQYAGAVEADKAILLGATDTIKNTVLLVEQKYSDAAKNDTTNAAKLEDALGVLAPLLTPTLAALKVPVPSAVTDIADRVSAAVAILKNYKVPVTTPNAQGT